MTILGKAMQDKRLSPEEKALFAYLHSVDEHRNLDCIRIIAHELSLTKTEVIRCFSTLILKEYIRINNKSIEINFKL